MWQRFLAAFDTPEGWAVAAGLFWALLSHFAPAIPPQFTIDGLGSVSAAMCIAFGLPFVLSKMGWAIPFQPITREALAKRDAQKRDGATPVAVMVVLVLIALVAFLGFAKPSQAATSQGAAARWSAGAIVRGAWYSADSSASSSAFSPGLSVVYSTTQNFSVGLAGEVNAVHDPWGSVSLSLNSAALGTKPGDALRVGAGIAFVHYWGAVPGWVRQRDSYRVPVDASWVMLRDGLKRPSVYVQCMVTVDPRNAHGRRESLALLIPILKPPPAAP